MDRVNRFSKITTHGASGQRGFSLVEILVVVAIVVAIAVTALVNTSSGDRVQRVRRQASDIALALAEARDKAASNVPFNGANVYGYGVVFDTEDSQKYYIFADINNNMACDDVACGCQNACEKELVEQKLLDPRTYIYTLAVGDPANPGDPQVDAGGTLNVYFCPPNPNIFIFGRSDDRGINCSAIGSTTHTRADISVAGTGGATDKNAVGVITVRKTGAISIGVNISSSPAPPPAPTPPPPAATASLAQIRYHWRNDVGAETTNTSATGGTENTVLTNLAKATKKHLRVEISNEGIAPATGVLFRLEYRAKGSQCDSGGAWTMVPVVPTTEHWKISDSLYITNGTPTTDIAQGIGGMFNENNTFVSGYLIDATDATPGITLDTTNFTELEYSVEATSSALDNESYCFRVTNAGVTDTFNYTRYPEATILGADLALSHYRWRNDNGTEVTATWPQIEDTKLEKIARHYGIRLRMLIDNQGSGTSASVPYQLEYSLKRGFSCGGGDETFAAVPTDTSAEWQMLSSTYITDGAATTNISGGLSDPAGKTFVAGRIKESGNTTSGITLANNNFTELEYAIQANNNSLSGASYCFRVSNAGSITSFNYKVFPEISTLVQPAQAVSATDKYAWSEVAGWIDFRPDFANNLYVQVSASDFEGYAKVLSTAGYISFNCVTSNDCTAADFKTSRTTDGDVLGWAWSENYGWISMNCANPILPTYPSGRCAAQGGVDYKVSINAVTDRFSGWAWNDVVGWISFNCTNVAGECTATASLPDHPDGYFVALEGGAGDVLFVILSANPASGNTPLTTSLTAQVSGSAVGTINYHFDCTNDGTNEINILNQNPTTGDGSYTATNACTYSSAGVYNAKVTVERGTSSNSVLTSVVVSTPFSDLITRSLNYAPSPPPYLGGSMTFSGTVFNQGNASAGASLGRFCIDNVNCGTSTTGRVGSDINVSALAAGTESVTYSSAAWTVALGSHTVYWCADANPSTVTEGVESNNCSSSTFAIFNGPTVPTVTTNAASSVGNNSATLNSTVNPNGGATTAWYRYSTTSPGTCNDTFGTKYPSAGTSLGSGTSNISNPQTVTTFAANTTYYFCAIANNVAGTTLGTVLSFTTTNTSAPAVTTFPASGIGATAATLNGSGNPNGLATTGWFRYSTSNPGSCNDTFGTRAPSTGGTSLGSGATAVGYSNSLAGLTQNTTYYFCAIANNSLGTNFGSVLNFTTISAPAMITNPATGVTTSAATLNGNGNPNGDATTAWFRYQATTNPGSCNDTFGTRVPATGGTSLGSGTAGVGYSQNLTGLASGTTFYFCAIGNNSVGTTFGSVLSFATGSAGAAPTVVTNAASSVTSSGATLNGSANPNSLATTGWFRYSTTSPGTCNDTFGTRIPASGGSSLGSGITSVAYSQALGSLLPQTTYYFCALASNTSGTGTGSVLSFATLPSLIISSFGASPPSGSVPLSANLSASISGTATGTINYSFWWNCSDTTNNVSTATASCGALPAPASGTCASNSVGYKCEAVSNTTQTTSNNSYASAGTFRGKVIVERGSAVPAEAGATITVSATAPTTTTNAASSVAGTSATLNGSASPGGIATTGWFRYSTTSPGICNDTFGTRAPSTGGSSLGSGSSAVAFSQAISGLTAGSTYYFCAIANNAQGTGVGSVLSFITPAVPGMITSAASGITSSGATLNGSGDPNGLATTAWFRYSTTSPGTCNDTFGTRIPASGGSSLGSGNGAVSYNQAVSGLAASTIYYFCAIGNNSQGTGLGSVLSFTTVSAGSVPTMTTNAATGVTGTSAILNGAGNPNGFATTAWFRYSATSPGTCNDTFGTRVPTTGGAALGSGTAPISYNQSIASLAEGTTYYYCAIGNNASGTGVGLVTSFTTTSSLSISSFGASPASGTAPLSANLSATVGGTATGTINYSFWWNCSNTSNSVATVTTACGALTAPAAGTCSANSVGYKCSAVSNTTQTTSNNSYASAGTYTGKIIVERGAATPAEARTTITVSSAPTTTLATGTDPSSATLAPGTAATMADAFTFAASSGTDSVTAVTVTFASGTSSSLSLLEITNDAGTVVHGSVSNPTLAVQSVTLTTPISVTTAATQFKIRVTPKSHAAMPAPPDQSYALTARISAWTGTNIQAGSDSAGATITIDNLSPGNVTAATGSAGNTQVTINWTNPADSDLSQIIVLRRATTAVGDTPVEGSSYSVGGVIGSSTIACVVATPTAACTDTGLTNGTAYHYKLFAKDSRGNYSATGVVPTGSPFTPVGATLTVSTFTATPASGTAPLSANLSATVGGTATGTINYSFWWNCSQFICICRNLHRQDHC